MNNYVETFEFEGKTIIADYTDYPFDQIAAKLGVEVLSKKQIKYPFINTGAGVESGAFLYEYISQKTHKKSYAYQISYFYIDDVSFQIFSCAEKINDLAGMIRHYDEIDKEYKEELKTIITNEGIAFVTINKDQFQCKGFYLNTIRDYRYQWAYKDTNGNLYRGITKTEDETVKEAKKYGYRN